uniref:Uncharacterized protein n=1 Tax=Arundo donax TaxID=35708 RepID=A0A0A9E7S4_ARUDO
MEPATRRWSARGVLTRALILAVAALALRLLYGAFIAVSAGGAGWPLYLAAVVGAHRQEDLRPGGNPVPGALAQPRVAQGGRLPRRRPRRPPRRRHPRAVLPRGLPRWRAGGARAAGARGVRRRRRREEAFAAARRRR